MEILGIDVGGSGIKAAIVDTEAGELCTERWRVDTPKPSKPKAMTKAIVGMIEHFGYEGPVGCCFPTVMVNGYSKTAGNIHKAWRGLQADELFAEASGQPFFMINDADAAGLAEMRLGAGRGLDGLVMTITIGTGLGSGVFLDGVLVPNIEAGRMPGRDGEPIEYYAGDRARKKAGISWKKWGRRFNWFLERTARVFAPDHFILGGGAARKFDKYREELTVSVPIHIARFGNQAGIVGAALAAVDPPD